MKHLWPNLSKLENNLCMIIDLLVVHGWLRPILCFTSSRDLSRSGSRFSFNIVFISCLSKWIGNQKRSWLSFNQILSDKRLDRTKILSNPIIQKLNFVKWNKKDNMSKKLPKKRKNLLNELLNSDSDSDTDDEKKICEKTHKGTCARYFERAGLYYLW